MTCFQVYALYLCFHRNIEASEVLKFKGILKFIILSKCKIYQISRMFFSKDYIHYKKKNDNIRKYLNQGPRKSPFPLNLADRRMEVCMFVCPTNIQTDICNYIYFYMSAFCSLTDRPKYKIFIEQMLIYERNVHSRLYSILIRGRENRVSPNIADRWTYGWSDIRYHSVASLLKTCDQKLVFFYT